MAQTHVLGGSYGGMVAQWLLHCYLQRRNRVILSHTGGPRNGPRGFGGSRGSVRGGDLPLFGNKSNGLIGKHRPSGGKHAES